MDVAVGFDFDHTLGLDHRLEKTVALDMLAAYAAGRGVTYDPAAAAAAMDGVLHAYRAGEQTVEAAMAGFFERFAPGGGNTIVDEAQRFRENVLARVAEFVVAVPGAAETLAALDAMTIPYALLTNGWSPLQEEKARLIGFSGPVFVSERIGVRKPAREAFETLTKYFALPFERIWYVGDDPEIDCVAAQDFGMTSVWFDWEGRPYPADATRPAHVIHALDELPKLLEGSLESSGSASRS
ncbi:MAG: HAD family hydrolase [Candidatus Eremiobacteraeota bacterium]|nr:HAD family hydrolase [Candidatus Eremiobacteraeota bacterium]MBC5801596.1 HAD family hydrolase [Candidatus Eremiobacteraeota bacterium]MBC5822640.1 HAD family hydrolase [Candidatus Eremiobacteraeota bacterium]